MQLIFYKKQPKIGRMQPCYLVWFFWGDQNEFL